MGASPCAAGPIAGGGARHRRQPHLVGGFEGAAGADHDATLDERPLAILEEVDDESVLEHLALVVGDLHLAQLGEVELLPGLLGGGVGGDRGRPEPPLALTEVWRA